MLLVVCVANCCCLCYWLFVLLIVVVCVTGCCVLQVFVYLLYLFTVKGKSSIFMSEKNCVCLGPLQLAESCRVLSSIL